MSTKRKNIRAADRMTDSLAQQTWGVTSENGCGKSKQQTLFSDNQKSESVAFIQVRRQVRLNKQPGRQTDMRKTHRKDEAKHWRTNELKK